MQAQVQASQLQQAYHKAVEYDLLPLPISLEVPTLAQAEDEQVDARASFILDTHKIKAANSK